MKKAFQKDEIRTKSIALPKNRFFCLEVLSLIILAILSWLLFIWSLKLKNDSRFLRYKGQNSSTDLENLIDYNNDTIIIPETKKYHKINEGCKFGLASSILANFFLIFIIYLSIRVAREKDEKYKDYYKGKKVGLNMCMIFIFILFSLTVIVLTLTAEIYIIIAITQKTYKFIHNLMKNQLITNSLLFVSYVMIIIFYCKI